jgi:putative tricarboxylic transport membrane protein
MSANAPAGIPSRLVKSPRELLAGLLLLALAAIGYFGTLSLNPGHLSAMGPGMMPKITSIGVAVFGVALVAQSLVLDGAGAGVWNLRGIVFVFGAVLIFAATIRDWGLAVAGPLSVIVSAFADRETRLIEIVPFAAVMTIFSAALFKWLLALPIPLLPPLLGF